MRTWSHERLAYLLINVDPSRVIQHFGNVVKAGGTKDEERPVALSRGEEAFRAGNYPSAITAFEEWLATDPPSETPGDGDCELGSGPIRDRRHRVGCRPARGGGGLLSCGGQLDSSGRCPVPGGAHPLRDRRGP